eukprot:MONOS_7742.1-p1 / transcript=MONOS_7742.1 / gene=MONOS_7742 / organism=Monocercomonoides_exilis_PA203 / gene_product=unspecified product / transcript_product=unspecified product / location=Mono_scaffold00272:71264-73570(-) / protein_length=626 / sequence_SO=supercontig / SO=protein_coding / is_pseudo=false
MNEQGIMNSKEFETIVRCNKFSECEPTETYSLYAPHLQDLIFSWRFDNPTFDKKTDLLKKLLSEWKRSLAIRRLTIGLTSWKNERAKELEDRQTVCDRIKNGDAEPGVEKDHERSLESQWEDEELKESFDFGRNGKITESTERAFCIKHSCKSTARVVVTTIGLGAILLLLSVSDVFDKFYKPDVQIIGAMPVRLFRAAALILLLLLVLWLLLSGMQMAHTVGCCGWKVAQLENENSYSSWSLKRQRQNEVFGFRSGGGSFRRLQKSSSSCCSRIFNKAGSIDNDGEKLSCSEMIDGECVIMWVVLVDVIAVLGCICAMIILKWMETEHVIFFDALPPPQKRRFVRPSESSAIQSYLFSTSSSSIRNQIPSNHSILESSASILHSLSSEFIEPPPSPDYYMHYLEDKSFSSPSVVFYSLFLSANALLTFLTFFLTVLLSPSPFRAKQDARHPDNSEYHTPWDEEELRSSVKRNNQIENENSSDIPAEDPQIEDELNHVSNIKLVEEDSIKQEDDEESKDDEGFTKSSSKISFLTKMMQSKAALSESTKNGELSEKKQNDEGNEEEDTIQNKYGIATTVEIGGGFGLDSETFLDDEEILKSREQAEDDLNEDENDSEDNSESSDHS